ncbi:MAG: cupin domain-containing protein [Vicinamibacterales bacterium]
MSHVRLTALVGGGVLAIASVSHSQSTPPRGAATHITHAEIQDIVRKNAAVPVSDTQIRVVNVNGEYNVGAGVVRRARPGGPNSIEHSQISEVYYMIEGTATLTTGGTMEDAKPAPAESAVVKVLNGPSTSGGKVTGGRSQTMTAGDVVIIPPNTPHWFSQIDADIVYLVVRIDPHQVLPAGYGAK